MAETRTSGGWKAFSEKLNTDWHKPALLLYSVVVVAHWAEHLAQAFQIYALDWPVPEARGVLGMPFPWLVTSEWMHYGYAILMMVSFIILRHGFVGRSKTWWKVAMWIQVWHHFEHLLLLLQALTGANLMGGAKPTSIAQLLIPRVELHLFYNTLVTIPMIIAMIYHLRPSAEERAMMRCACALRHVEPAEKPKAGVA
ncbi:hypothetical protein ACPZ19_18295 [Amycolatopsis lurida]